MSSEAAGPPLARAAARILPWLAEAADRAGVDFEALVRTARLESGFNPAARARTSSAAGLFQFIESTWLDMLARHGPRHGISAASRTEALGLRMDPRISALMGAELMAENRARLERELGRRAGPLDLYLAHFLGPAGALAFLKGLSVQPDRPADELLPAAARANRPIFYAAGGVARSVAEVHALLARRFEGDGSAPARPRAAGPATAQPAGSGLAPASPAAGDIPSGAARAAQAAYLLLAHLGR